MIFFFVVSCKTVNKGETGRWKLHLPVPIRMASDRRRYYSVLLLIPVSFVVVSFLATTLALASEIVLASNVIGFLSSDVSRGFPTHISTPSCLLLGNLFGFHQIGMI